MSLGKVERLEDHSTGTIGRKESLFSLDLPTIQLEDYLHRVLSLTSNPGDPG